ncbi:Sec-independent protein translocase protein TatB [Candidatus Symbiobacter mobilis]|uniref:Sec-independent protein translocase protein TatB n=1 Tax=Candidatus Symbiobacter mobilis CR TaxID=946483 RepID=U5N5U1_9BURK|nr:Sec-independent protein translocase protein TatB [Candidatus Symbiobacter mobilis]AGX86851.1 sec-independent protein translocase protein TatB [Candidatus Symbiobacter mobilis CR]
MVDLGISKLLLIATVALVVIGPHKLPHVARIAGTLLGRARRYLATVQAEVERSMYLEELRAVQTTVASAVDGLHDLHDLQVTNDKHAMQDMHGLEGAHATHTSHGAVATPTFAPVSLPMAARTAARLQRTSLRKPQRTRLRSDAALALRARRTSVGP